MMYMKSTSDSGSSGGNAVEVQVLFRAIENGQVPYWGPVHFLFPVERGLETSERRANARMSGQDVRGSERGGLEG